MKRLVLSACALTIGATLALNSWCAAENTTTINILSPRNGEKVSETFDIKYEILNAPAGNHAQQPADIVTRRTQHRRQPVAHSSFQVTAIDMVIGLGMATDWLDGLSAPNSDSHEKQNVVSNPMRRWI